MKSLKIFGWILLILGLIVIFYTLANSYNIFTGKSQPPAIFKTEEGKTTLSQKTLSPKEETEKMVEEKLKGQLQIMMPTDSLLKLLNLISWSILAGILIFGGTQISGLGIKLINPHTKEG